MNGSRLLRVGSLMLLLSPVVAEAGGGLVALQTAASSCRNDSTDIYVNCGNGTVTDNRTGLVWLANADCVGLVSWYTAMDFVAGLSDIDASLCQAAGYTPAECDCGLTDGSSPGEWRLPSADEWVAMVSNALGGGSDPDCSPSITNDSGEGCWADGPSSFSGVVPSNYWTMTTNAGDTAYVWHMNVASGDWVVVLKGSFTGRVWPVRGGQ